MRRWFILFIVAMLIAPVSGEAQTVIPTPKVSKNPNSSGLGLTIPEWEFVHGTLIDDDGIYKDYWGDPKKLGTTIRYFIVTSNQRIWFIDYSTDDEEMLSLTDAEKIASSMLPVDSVVLQEVTTRDAYPMTIYQSDWLVGQFPPDEWEDDIPGSFVVIYRYEPDVGVWGFVIGLGSSE